MAEMTAQEAIALLNKPNTGWTTYALHDFEAKQIAAIIQQQAQTINHQNLQIAKLQEDLIKAISGKDASSDV